MTESDDDLASVVHGGLLASHAISAAYFYLKDDPDTTDYAYAGVHFAAGVFSAVSLIRHLTNH